MIADPSPLAQCCSAGSRVYVADDVFDDFLALSIKLAKDKVLGDPRDAKVQGGSGHAHAHT